MTDWFGDLNDRLAQGLMKGCSHGRTFEEPCVECKLVSAREGLAWAEQNTKKYSKLIAELEAELATYSVTSNGRGTE